MYVVVYTSCTFIDNFQKESEKANNQCSFNLFIVNLTSVIYSLDYEGIKYFNIPIHM